SKSTTLATLTISSQLTILAQATKLNNSVANSLTKKKKAADQVANIKTSDSPMTTTKNLTATNNITTINKSLDSRKELLVDPMLSANHVKKEYYIHRIKESLWSTFGISNVKLDSNNPNSDTFLALIIKYTFISEDKCTYANAIWTQAVLELIFDKNYLLVKLDSDVVDTWYQKLLKETNTYTSFANLQVKSLDSIDVDDLYKSLFDFNSESHLSNNDIKDNNGNENYITGS
ncbi:7993_t:CDS:2, partial [Dentiscutata heterogama]